MNTKKINYTENSGNVYQDLNLPNSEERLAKAKLAMRIEKIISGRKLKQTEAAKILKINQPKISALMNGQLTGFSMGKLIYFLNCLNQDIEICVKEKIEDLNHTGRINVIEDVCFDGMQSPHLKIRLELISLIKSYIKKHRLTRKKAAELMQVDIAKVSDIFKNKIASFTIDTLIQMLERLGVHMTLKKAT